MVLFLFVIWLLNLQAEPVPIGHLGLKFFATIAVAAMAAELFAFLAKTKITLGAVPVAAGYGSIDSLAQTLFGQYLMAFETTSILLLVAVIGAVAVARRAPARGARRSVAQAGNGVMMVSYSWLMALSAAIFAIGVAGVLLRRNILVMFMSIELMLNAVNLAFVTLGRGAWVPWTVR